MSNPPLHHNLFGLANYKFDAESQVEPKAFLDTFGLGQRIGNTQVVRLRDQALGSYNPAICVSGYEFLDENHKKETFESRVHTVFDGKMKDLDYFTGQPLYIDLKTDFYQKYSLFSQIKDEIKTAQTFLLASGDLEHVPTDRIDYVFYRLSFLNEFLAIDHQAIPPRLILAQKLIDNAYLFLQDEIALKFYLQPYLDGEADSWLRTRRCQECGKLFPYKQKRARFCSPQCGMKEANRKRRAK